MIDDVCAQIVAVDDRAAERTRRVLDGKTKPVGSLGRLEEIAARLAAIRRGAEPRPFTKTIVVMGADHGVVDEGVSAYPPEVTAQMLANFVRGGAAINVLARHAGARVVVVDMGTRVALPDSPDIRSVRIGPGTRNFARGPAMTRDEAVRAVAAGVAIARALAAEGTTLLGLGEMGIGNTTASSAIAAVLTGVPVAEVTGRGTGIDDVGYARKVAAIQRGLEVNRPDPGDVLSVLSKVGGFEIAGLCGVVLGAAQARIPVVMDGFIAGAAALAAVRLAPLAAGYLFAAHRSVEAGHRHVLQAIDARPILELELRLGEGTGAALAMGLIEAAVRIEIEMATFASAGVTDKRA